MTTIQDPVRLGRYRPPASSSFPGVEMGRAEFHLEGTPDDHDQSSHAGGRGRWYHQIGSDYRSERDVPSEPIPELLALAEQVLQDYEVPNAANAWIDDSGTATTSMIGWDMGTRPPAPLILLGSEMQDRVTLLHEAAHHIDRYRKGTMYRVAKDVDEVHDAAWRDSFVELLDRYSGHHELAERFAEVDLTSETFHLAGTPNDHDQSSHAGGGSAEPDYQGLHRPTDTGPRAFDLMESEATDGLDVYENPHHYTGHREGIPETIAQLSAARGNPQAKLTVYRAAPEDSGIHDGDWVTLSRSYAELHARSNAPMIGPDEYGPDLPVFEKEVTAAEVRWAMDDLMEWGYYPSRHDHEAFHLRGTEHDHDQQSHAGVSGLAQAQRDLVPGRYYKRDEFPALTTEDDVYTATRRWAWGGLDSGDLPYIEMTEAAERAVKGLEVRATSNAVLGVGLLNGMDEAPKTEVPHYRGLPSFDPERGVAALTAATPDLDLAFEYLRDPNVGRATFGGGALIRFEPGTPYREAFAGTWGQTEESIVSGRFEFTETFDLLEGEARWDNATGEATRVYSAVWKGPAGSTDTEEFHLQGQHDQKTHGRRYTAIGDLREPDSGFTVDPTSLRPLTTGWAVALLGTDRLVVADTAYNDDGTPGERLLDLVLERVTAAVNTGIPDGTQPALGGWHNPDDGKIEINVTAVFPADQRDAAERFGRDNDQIAIANLDAINAGDWDNAIVQIGGTGGDRDTEDDLPLAAGGGLATQLLDYMSRPIEPGSTWPGVRKFRLASTEHDHD